MKELNIMEATVLTSPNPLTLICSKKEDGSTNLAPICFVSYLSFNPPMVGFATGKQSHTGKRVRETGKVVVTVPGESNGLRSIYRSRDRQGGRQQHRDDGCGGQRHPDSGGHPAGDGGYLAAVGGGGRPYPAHLSGGQVPGR